MKMGYDIRPIRCHSSHSLDGVLSGLNEKEELVKDDDEVDRAQEKDRTSDKPESAVQTQEDQAEGDKNKFPDPELLAMELDHGPDNRIGLPSLQVQNGYGEQGVKDVQPDNH
jgi:hypothetical protein